MEEQPQRINDLLHRYHQGDISEADLAKLIEWYDSFEKKPLFSDGLSPEQLKQVKADEFNLVNARLDQRQVVRPRLPLRWAIAASLFFCLFIGYFLIQKQPTSNPMAQIKAADFPAGSNKAILTLAGNQQIVLDDTQNGKLAEQGNTVIRKTSAGQVVYDEQQAGSKNNGQALINTMTTPRGGQYHLTLADGTVAWLNAASSITYPTVFLGKDRQVEITGEVYFEVAHMADKPFRVKSNGQTVEVLGTHFDVNAYVNENSVRTSLLQGSVKVSVKGQQTILTPGQQAIYAANGLSTTSADMDEVLAWKTGYFHFVDADIKTIMRQFARWYDVDIEFEGPITKETFTGRLPRSWPLNRVMKIVESSKSVQLKIEGRRIMVTM